MQPPFLLKQPRSNAPSARAVAAESKITWTHRVQPACMDLRPLLPYGCAGVIPHRIWVSAAEDLDLAVAIVHARERQIVGRRGVGAPALAVPALTVPLGVRIVVHSSRVHAVVRAGELSAAVGGAGVGAEARHVVSSVRVVVGVNRVLTAPDVARAIVLVVLPSIPTNKTCSCCLAIGKSQ